MTSILTFFNLKNVSFICLSQLFFVPLQQVMIEIENDKDKKLKGIIFHKNDIIGVCDNVETYLDILCQIKQEKSDDYRMEVDVKIDDNTKRTYVYRFSSNGKMIPLSYPGVKLWIDELDEKLLYLHNFSSSEVRF